MKRIPLPVGLFLGAVVCASQVWANNPIVLPNPGFEEGTRGWVPGVEDVAGKLSQLSPEAARTGKFGLRVTQPEGGPGSWYQSVPVAVEPAKTYRLQFWARTIKDSGIGVWVQFFDADEQVIKLPNRAQVAVQVNSDSREWTEYHLDVTLPPGAVTLTYTVHAYSKREVKADFDDFSLVASVPLSSSH
jgi:hypothetical protein